MNEPLHFKGYDYGADFDRARFQLATPFQYLDIALDVATANMQVEIAGDFLYIDTAFDGVATIELNVQQDAPLAPFQVKAGFAMEALFKKLKISWAAQPNKKIRILYSTGQRIIPALTGNLAITGTVATLEDGMTYGASYKSITALLANTPDVVFTPAANVNGAIIHASNFTTSNATDARSCYLAKVAPPVSVIDGDVILMCDALSVGTNYLAAASLKKPIKIAAGKGYYYISNIAELANQAMRSVLYTLL